MFKKYFYEATKVIIALFTNFNSKFSIEKERHYQSSLKEEKLKSGLITTTITAIVYVMFFIADTWSLPSQLLTAGAVRCFFLFLSIYILYLIIKKEDVFVQYYQLIMGCYYLIAGSGIALLIGISEQSEIATDSYYSGIMIIIFVTHGATYLQPNIALMVSSTLTFITLTSLLLIPSPEQTNTLYLIITNLFLLISSVIAGVLCMDIRNRFSRNNFLLQANAERLSSEKSQFIAAASHDIRQPLQAISFLVNALRSGNNQPKDDILFERLENSVESMSDLLNNMLDVSKLDAQVIEPKPKHFLLSMLFKRLQGELNPFTEDKGIKLIVNNSDELVFADAILLEQVLNNLLSNAIRYTHSGSITLTAQSASEFINISIKDTGMGIANTDKEAIFLEFHQIHNPERDQNKGLGLGLSIVKRLCALQNWPLALDSKLGVGSCFSFKVPKGDRDKIQVTEKINMNKNLAKLDVIVIDDHEGICFSLSNTLMSWDCSVRSFESIETACETINKLPTWKPNLIISDYRLRNHATGVEAIKTIKEKLGYPIEAIVITGDTATEEILDIKKSGLTVLHKPIKPAKLRLIITKKMKEIIDS